MWIDHTTFTVVEGQHKKHQWIRKGKTVQGGGETLWSPFKRLEVGDVLAPVFPWKDHKRRWRLASGQGHWVDTSRVTMDSSRWLFGTTTPARTHKQQDTGKLRKSACLYGRAGGRGRGKEEEQGATDLRRSTSEMTREGTYQAGTVSFCPCQQNTSSLHANAKLVCS